MGFINKYFNNYIIKLSYFKVKQLRLKLTSQMQKLSVTKPGCIWDPWDLFVHGLKVGKGLPQTILEGEAPFFFSGRFSKPFRALGIHCFM